MPLKRRQINDAYLDGFQRGWETALACAESALRTEKPAKAPATVKALRGVKNLAWAAKLKELSDE